MAKMISFFGNPNDTYQGTFRIEEQKAPEMDVSGETVNVLVAVDAGYFERCVIQRIHSRVNYASFPNWLEKLIVKHSPFKKMNHNIKSILIADGLPPKGELGSTSEKTKMYKIRGAVDSKIKIIKQTDSRFEVFAKPVRENYANSGGWNATNELSNGSITNYRLELLEAAVNNNNWGDVNKFIEAVKLSKMKYSQKGVDTRISEYITRAYSFTEYKGGKTLLVLFASDMDFVHSLEQGVLINNGNFGALVLHFGGMYMSSGLLDNDRVMSDSNVKNYWKNYELKSEDVRAIALQNPSEDAESNR
jgi:hypothetical protein